MKDVPIIKDATLAPSRQKKIDWVKPNMLVLSHSVKNLIKEQPLEGRKAVVCMHLEAKTAYLTQVIKAGGAR